MTEYEFLVDPHNREEAEVALVQADNYTEARKKLRLLVDDQHRRVKLVAIR